MLIWHRLHPETLRTTQPLAIKRLLILLTETFHLICAFVARKDLTENVESAGFHSVLMTFMCVFVSFLQHFDSVFRAMCRCSG